MNYLRRNPTNTNFGVDNFFSLQSITNATTTAKILKPFDPIIIFGDLENLVVDKPNEPYGLLISSPFSRDYSNEELRLLYSKNKIPRIGDYSEIVLFDSSYLLYVATEEDNLSTFNEALDAGADIDHKFSIYYRCFSWCKNNTCIHIACHRGFLPIINRLFELDVDYNARNSVRLLYYLLYLISSLFIIF